MTRRHGLRTTSTRNAGRICAVLLALTAFAFIADSAGASIIPVADSRHIEYTVYQGNPPNTVLQLEPDSPFALFDASLGGGRATQTSSITATAIHGVGSGDRNGPFVGTGYFGTSVLDVTFEVDSAQDYDLFGALGSGGDAQGSHLRWYEDGVLQFQLNGPSCPCAGEEFELVSTTLSLSPGVTYRILTAALQLGFSGDGSFDITLQEVPEPSTALLITLGLVSLAATHRKR